ncbi:MAG: glycosyltransferase, partial [Gaiellaceae bacterium]
EEAYGIEVPIRSTTKETLREALRPLVADSGLRRRLGEASRAYAEKLHDVDAIAGQLVGIYERVLGRT